MPAANETPEQPDRFETLYQSSYKAIFGYVLRRTGDDLDTVADLVAEVFVVALRKRDGIPDPPEDRLWLFGVARRVLLDHQQRGARRRRLESRLRAQAAVIDLAAVDPEPLQLRVRTAMEELRPAYREVLQLVAWDGLSHAEAAQVLGCSVNAVALRIRKAKARLRDALSRACPESLEAVADTPQILPISSRSKA